MLPQWLRCALSRAASRSWRRRRKSIRQRRRRTPGNVPPRPPGRAASTRGPRRRAPPPQHARRRWEGALGNCRLRACPWPSPGEPQSWHPTESCSWRRRRRRKTSSLLFFFSSSWCLLSSPLLSPSLSLCLARCCFYTRREASLPWRRRRSSMRCLPLQLWDQR